MICFNWVICNINVLWVVLCIACIGCKYVWSMTLLMPICQYSLLELDFIIWHISVVISGDFNQQGVMTSSNISDVGLMSAASIGTDQLAIIKLFTILSSTLGTLGNLLTVVAILKGQLYSNVSFVFILNLSICNLIHCVLFQPLLAIQAYHDVWTNNQAFCVVYAYGLFANLGTELWGYIGITFNRYFCVVHHNLYKTIYGNNRLIAAMLVFCWLFYHIMFLLPVTRGWGHFEYAPQKLVCYPFAGYNCRGFCLFTYAIAIGSTVPTIMFCYAAIIHKYVKTQRKVGLAREKSSSKGEISLVKTEVERNRNMSELKMAFTILAVIVVFGTCRLPFMILYVYDPSMSKVNPLVHTLLIHIGSSSNWINPIIYSFSNKTIYNTLKKLFCTRNKTFIPKSWDVCVCVYIWLENFITNTDFLQFKQLVKETSHVTRKLYILVSWIR